MPNPFAFEDFLKTLNPEDRDRIVQNLQRSQFDTGPVVKSAVPPMNPLKPFMPKMSMDEMTSDQGIAHADAANIINPVMPSAPKPAPQMVPVNLDRGTFRNSGLNIAMDKTSDIVQAMAKESPMPPGFEQSGLFSNLSRTNEILRAMQQPKRNPDFEEEIANKPEIVTGSEGGSSRNAPPFVLDVGQGGLGTVENLKAAQQQARDARLVNQLGKASEVIGASIARTAPVAQGLFDQNIQQADNFVKDHLAQVEQEKTDPKSPISKAFQQYVKRFGVEVRGDMSAAMGEKLLPVIFKSFEAEENRAARKDEVMLRLKAMQTQKEMARDQRVSDRQDDYLKSAADFITRSDDYKAFAQSNRALQQIDEAIKNPGSVTDIGVLYNFIKGLDPNSVVREGEVRLGREGLSHWENLQTWFSKLGGNPRILPPRFLEEARAYVQMANSINKGAYDNVVRPRLEGAKSRGIPESRFGELDTFYQSAGPGQAINSGAQGGMVKVRRISDGVEKTLSADAAKKYLGNSNFEVIK